MRSVSAASRLSCVAALLAFAALRAASVSPAIIPYGVGEGNFGANGVGQTSGYLPNAGTGDFRWGWQDNSKSPDQGWFPNVGLPSGRVFRDDYKRFVWRELEPTPGVYDFSAIETHLARARELGRRFSFRVMCISEWEGDVDGDGQPDGKNAMPAYFEAQGLGRRMPSSKPECDQLFVPHWNDSVLLARVDALFAALGARFDGDPRLAYLDVGIYGHWAEWHMSGMGFPSIPPEINATPATRRHILDTVAAAFPRTRLVLMPDVDGDYPDRSGAGFVHAMENHPRIGVRKDNLSHDWFEQEVGDWFPNVRDAFRDRWKTAPFVTEFFGGENDDALVRAERQVIGYHVSAVATNQWWDTPQRREIGKAAGHRFQLNTATWPDSVASGHRFVLASRWSNVGVAPAYEDWAPTWELYHSGGALVWSARSRLDLQRLLPTTVNPDLDVNTEATEAAGTNAPVSITDELSLPAALPPGTYTLKVAIPLHQPGAYLPPLALATQGRDADGRYPLGTLLVAAPAAAAPAAELTPPATPIHATQTHTFTPTVSAPSAALARVELLANGELVATATAAPWSLTWTPATDGLHVLVARAIDTADHVGVSAPLSIAVAPAPNTAPSVALALQPAAGPYVAPVSFTLTATVSDPDGDAIARVEFYRGAVLLGSAATAPYVYTTSDIAPGEHTFAAKAIDARGKSAIADHTVLVTPPPRGTYGGVDRAITDRIEFEHYDIGGEGIAWHDKTAPNEGGALRNDSVDLGTNTDDPDGHNVGWVDAGEWLEYTLVVPSAGAYALSVRHASPPNVDAPVLRLALNGVQILGAQTLPRTGQFDWDFETWGTWQGPTVTLPAGRHVFRVSFDTGLVNYNWFRFTAQAPSGFVAWAQEQSISALPEADPDGDDASNLLEYALGTAPLVPNTGPDVRITNIEPGLTIAFFRARADLTYEVLASSDLVSWLVIATNPGGAGENAIVTDHVSINPRRFLRLRVTAP